MINKRMPNAAEAVADIPDGASIMVGGFGEAGSPIELLHALIDQGAKDLTIISNNCGSGEVGLAALLKARRVTKVICSFPKTANSTVFPELYREGFTELELVPQGTLAERLRAGGCGIPGFYTKTGVGTVIAEGKEHKEFNGQTYIMEEGLFADLSIVKAWKADATGNLIFRKTARNFNPPAAMSGKVCVAEVEEIVPTGSMDPDLIHLPGIYVHRIVQGTHEKRIEQRTTRPAA